MWITGWVRRHFSEEEDVKKGSVEAVAAVKEKGQVEEGG
jgi:hypothetical protein